MRGMGEVDGGQWMGGRGRWREGLHPVSHNYKCSILRVKPTHLHSESLHMHTHHSLWYT